MTESPFKPGAKYRGRGLYAPGLSYRFVKPERRGHVAHCAPLAASIALQRPYWAVATILKPRFDTDYPAARLDCFLARYGFDYFDMPRVQPLYRLRLPRGRQIAFMDVKQEGKWFGHYAGIVDHTLYDWIDSRVGMLLGLWVKN